MVREETPVEPTGPRPYDASPATAAPPSIQTAPLTAAPAATPATPPAPVIPVQPLN